MDGLTLEVEPKGGGSPLLESALDNSFPADLAGGQILEIPAFSMNSSAQILHVTLRWREKKGKVVSREQTVHAKWR